MSTKNIRNYRFNIVPFLTPVGHLTYFIWKHDRLINMQRRVVWNAMIAAPEYIHKCVNKLCFFFKNSRRLWRKLCWLYFADLLDRPQVDWRIYWRIWSFIPCWIFTWMCHSLANKIHVHPKLSNFGSIFTFPGKSTFYYVHFSMSDSVSFPCCRCLTQHFY